MYQTDEVIFHRLSVDGLMKHQHVGLSCGWVVVGHHSCDGQALNSTKGLIPTRHVHWLVEVLDHWTVLAKHHCDGMGI